MLEKDVVLYLGVKLRINGSGKGNSVTKAIFQGLSKVSVKLVIIALQGTIFVLAQAATTSTTKKSCSDIDLVGNSFGYFFTVIILTIFYIEKLLWLSFMYSST
jgi:hypothetical protein